MSEWLVGADGTMLPWMNGVQFASFTVFVVAVVLFVWFRWIATEDRVRRGGSLLDPAGHATTPSDQLPRWRRWHGRWVTSQVDFAASWSRVTRRAAPVVAAGALLVFVVSSLARL